MIGQAIGRASLVNSAMKPKEMNSVVPVTRCRMRRRPVSGSARATTNSETAIGIRLTAQIQPGSAVALISSPSAPAGAIGLSRKAKKNSAPGARNMPSTATVATVAAARGRAERRRWAGGRRQHRTASTPTSIRATRWEAGATAAASPSGSDRGSDERLRGVDRREPAEPFAAPMSSMSHAIGGAPGRTASQAPTNAIGTKSTVWTTRKGPNGRGPMASSGSGGRSRDAEPPTPA